MSAYWFHPLTPASPLCAALIILSKHLNVVHDVAVKRVSYSPYTSANGLRPERQRLRKIVWSEGCFFSPYLRFDTVTLPLGLLFRRKQSDYLFRLGKKWKVAGVGGVCASGSAGKGSETHVVLKWKGQRELELVVVDKRAKRKESRVLDSNGESGALGGLCPVWEGGGGGWR